MNCNINTLETGICIRGVTYRLRTMALEEGLRDYGKEVIAVPLIGTS